MLGLELVQQKQKVHKIQLIRIKEATTDNIQSRQKSNIDHRRRKMEFEVADHVFLKLSPPSGVIRFHLWGLGP